LDSTDADVSPENAPEMIEEIEPDVTPEFVPDAAPPVEPEKPESPFPTTTALLPTLARRIDDLGGGLASASMRIDALGAATASLHSALSDRISEFGETVAKLARSQSDTIDEYRHGNDRSLAEMRRAITNSEAVLRKLSGRADELLRDSEALAELIREMSFVTPPPPPPPEGNGVAPMLEQISDELRRAIVELGDNFTRVEMALQQPNNDKLPDVAGELALLRDQLVQLEGPDVVGELASLRDQVAQLGGPDVAGQLASLRDQLEQLGGQVEQLGGQVEQAGGHVEQGGPDVASELASLRDEVQQVKRRIGLRARATVSLDDDQLHEMASAVNQRLKPPTLDDDDLSRIAEAIVLRLEASLEVVPGDTPEEAPAEPAPKPARPRKTSSPRKAAPSRSPRAR
jgi:chromosome segregation ATPase